MTLQLPTTPQPTSTDYALKQVLGEHAEQKGSYVSPDTLRFDVSHFQKITDEELRQVEKLVNEMIRKDYPMDEHRDTPMEEAKKMGAVASSVRSMATRFVLFASVQAVSSVVVFMPHQLAALVSSRLLVRAV